MVYYFLYILSGQTSLVAAPVGYYTDLRCTERYNKTLPDDVSCLVVHLDQGEGVVVQDLGDKPTGAFFIPKHI